MSRADGRIRCSILVRPSDLLIRSMLIFVGGKKDFFMKNALVPFHIWLKMLNRGPADTLDNFLHNNNLSFSIVVFSDKYCRNDDFYKVFSVKETAQMTDDSGGFHS